MKTGHTDDLATAIKHLYRQAEIMSGKAYTTEQDSGTVVSWIEHPTRGNSQEVDRHSEFLSRYK